MHEIKTCTLENRWHGEVLCSASAYVSIIAKGCHLPYAFSNQHWVYGAKKQKLFGTEILKIFGSVLMAAASGNI